MKPSRTLLALLPLALAAPLAAQGFEGTMKQQQVTVLPQGVAALAGDAKDPAQILEAVAAKVKGADASLLMTQDMTVAVKGTKMRVDGMGGQMGPGAYSVMDAGAAMVYMVAPQMKQIMFLSGADAAGFAQKMSERMGITPSTASAPVTTDLGTKQIAGVQAHGYKLVTPDGVGIVWVDPALKDVFAAFKDFQQKMSGLNPGVGQLQAAMGALGFPVLAQIVVKAPAMMGEGWLYNETTVSQVQKGPVADDLFTLPADFTKQDMAKMFQ